MFEKVNPSHPDKIADRIAGAIVDLAYKQEENPKIAVEVLIGHRNCTIIAETSTQLDENEIQALVYRIAGMQNLNFIQVPQDENLSKNQEKGIRCGDNGIFKGCYTTNEQDYLTNIVKGLYREYESDGKYIYAQNETKREIIACQSQIPSKAKFDEQIRELGHIHDGFISQHIITINPLGYWEGGTGVDTGATNRKLGSDMGDAVTGGGLWGKDYSKADVSVNIYLHIMAQRLKRDVKAYCSIGSEYVNVAYDNIRNEYTQVPFTEIVEIAREYVNRIGGFEKLAEWGLIRGE